MTTQQTQIKVSGASVSKPIEISGGSTSKLNNLGFESVSSSNKEISLGRHLSGDMSNNDYDTNQEDLSEDGFLTNLAKDKFVKIDTGVEMMVVKEDNEIIFRKNGPDTDKLVGEYVMKLEPGELEKVILHMLSIQEGLYTDIRLKSNNIELRLTKNSKERFVITLSSKGTIVITMIAPTPAIIHRMIYVILFCIVK